MSNEEKPDKKQSNEGMNVRNKKPTAVGEKKVKDLKIVMKNKPQTRVI